MSITTEQAKTIMRMSGELETTGRLASLTHGDQNEWIMKNKNIQCALWDYLTSLTEVKWTSSSDAMGSIDEIKDVYLSPGDWEVHFYDTEKKQDERVRIALQFQSKVTTEQILAGRGYCFYKIDKIYRIR